MTTMTKAKTADLTGAQLDWAVAKAMGIEKVIIQDDLFPWSKDSVHCYIEEHGDMHGIVFSPSVEWSQGGPIIEREKIIILPPWPNAIGWYACIDENFESVYCHYDIEQSGDTPLEAAMRAYVASKLGDEVEVPEVQP